MDTHTITDTVRRLMFDRGLTGTAVAARAGVHPNTMHTWLRGERSSGGPTVFVLGCALRAIDAERPLSQAEREAVLAALGVAAVREIKGRTCG
ncbi:MAG: hypothetical protein IOD15_00300 [Phycisphaerales bacterium]|nr:hypothetical protein [Phycisphaerales bacterium]